VPVVYVDLSPDEERLALAILDPLSAMATTDQEMLDDLLGGLSAEGALAEMLSDLAGPTDPKDGLTDPDEVPDPVEDPYVQRGEVYLLGQHRIMCGDSTDLQIMAAFTGGAVIGLVFTDPPYNMAYRSKALGGIANDDLGTSEFVRLILSSGAVIKNALQDGGSYYICMGAAEFATVIGQLRKLGLPGRPIVWVKPSTGLGAQEYRPQFEVMLYGYKGQRQQRTWNGKRREADVWDFDADRGVIARETEQGTTIEVGSGVDTIRIVLNERITGSVISEDGSTSDVWRFGRERGRYVHPTQKPVALVERALQNSSNPGDAVFDPFLGSGTTLIAAERTGRVCYGVDLDPKYAQVAIERWEAFTGQKAERIDG
jgi:DNA modification methylase